MLVPGNHDMYVSEAAAFAARQWGTYMNDDEDVGGFPYLRRRGNVALVGLSSGVPTAPFLATGWLGAKQLAESKAVVKNLTDDFLLRSNGKEFWMLNAALLGAPVAVYLLSLGAAGSAAFRRPVLSLCRRSHVLQGG